MGGKERRVGIMSICVSPQGSKKSVNFPVPSSSSHMVTFRSPIYFIKYIYIKVPFCNSVGLATNVIFDPNSSFPTSDFKKLKQLSWAPKNTVRPEAGRYCSHGYTGHDFLTERWN